MNANIRTQLKGTPHTPQVDVQEDFSLDNTVESQTEGNHYQAIHNGQGRIFISRYGLLLLCRSLQQFLCDSVTQTPHSERDQNEQTSTAQSWIRLLSGIEWLIATDVGCV